MTSTKAINKEPPKLIQSLSTISSSSSTSIDTTLEAASTILGNPLYRFSTQSSLPWGHKPHALLEMSCYSYLLVVPYLLPCHPLAGCMFLLTAAASVASDHLYTGMNSAAHVLDKVVAPCTFLLALRAIYLTGGVGWALTSAMPLLCHVKAKAAAKQNLYEPFVLWHSLWHLLGVALIVTCCIWNRTMTECIDTTFIIIDTNDATSGASSLWYVDG